MDNQQQLIFDLLSEKEGYKIYYTIPKHKLDIGINKAIMFVTKDDEIVYLPTNKRSQFHMKRACDEFIEKQITNESDEEKIKKYILDTYTPENYYKLWLYMYAMVGEGFVAAEELLCQMQPDDEVFDYDMDKLADDLVKKLQGD